ncbi:YibE/F family protein [Actinomadura flavalba]|uniref:YibE/F family protein n=1 Tax=Actinomadura flavalba TaxID=1120938 RepID=UPI00036A850A|nr:YibE/F family protein [Actinomadura flavalba]
MGAGHSHRKTPASRPVVLACLAVIAPLALLTLASLVLMWPGDVRPSGEEGARIEKYAGTVTSVRLTPCANERVDPRKCGQATVLLADGPGAGRAVNVPLNDGPGSHVYLVDDKVVLLHNAEITDNPYQLSDHQRATQLWIIGAAFVLAVVAFGRWRGLRALVGLAVTFALLLFFLIPAIVGGAPPLWTAIVCAAAIMFIVLYLTHGVTVETTVAVVGTIASLVLTGLLATFAIGFTHLNGITDDSSFFLDSEHSINARGILLASIIIGALGVLDDVTVTQSATVSEVARANPAAGFAELYRAGARVGRAHIASVINTIILAYAGAALPLLLLFSIGREPLAEVMTSPIIAQEIVRSVAGTLGLIAAVPLTTALAAATLARVRREDVPSRRAAGEDAG